MAAALLWSAIFAAQVALAADPAKVLRVAFEVSETGFDPVKVTDNYSSQILRVVNSRRSPLKAGSAWKKIPLRSLKV